jgi:hypothetical protein
MVMYGNIAGTIPPEHTGPIYIPEFINVGTGATGINRNYVYDVTGTILITSNTFISTAAVPVSGTLTGLGGGTSYKFRVSVVPTGCMTCVTTHCPFSDVATLPVPCLPVEDVVAVITWVELP